MQYIGCDSYPVIMKRHLNVRTPIHGYLFSQNFQGFSHVSTGVFQVQRIARIAYEIKKHLLNLLIISNHVRQCSVHMHVETNAVFF